MYVWDGYSSISQDICVRLGSRLVWYNKTSVCFSGLQRGQKIHTRKIRRDQGIARASEDDGFHDQRPLDKAP